MENSNWGKWSRRFLQTFQHVAVILRFWFSCAVFNISVCGVNADQASDILLSMANSAQTKINCTQQKNLLIMAKV